MKRTMTTSHVSDKSFTATENRMLAKRKAYFGYLAYSAEEVSARRIEDALLANSAMPRVSSYGLEENPLLDGWWYTGVDEERFDQIIDGFSAPSLSSAGAR